MSGAQRAARHIARESGQIQPDKGRRTLTDGTVITGTKFSLKRGQATVKGIAPNGTSFLIAVPLAAIGL